MSDITWIALVFCCVFTVIYVGTLAALLRLRTHVPAERKALEEKLDQMQERTRQLWEVIESAMGGPVVLPAEAAQVFGEFRGRPAAQIVQEQGLDGDRARGFCSFVNKGLRSFGPRAVASIRSVMDWTAALSLDRRAKLALLWVMLVAQAVKPVQWDLGMRLLDGSVLIEFRDGKLDRKKAALLIERIRDGKETLASS